MRSLLHDRREKYATCLNRAYAAYIPVCLASPPYLARCHPGMLPQQARQMALIGKAGL